MCILSVSSAIWTIRNTKRGIEFRRWANIAELADVLHTDLNYLILGVIAQESDNRQRVLV